MRAGGRTCGAHFHGGWWPAIAAGLAAAAIATAAACVSTRVVTVRTTLDVATPLAPGSAGYEPELSARTSAAGVALASTAVSQSAARMLAGQPKASRLDAREVYGATRVFRLRGGRRLEVRFDARSEPAARAGLFAVESAYGQLVSQISAEVAGEQRRAIEQVRDQERAMPGSDEALALSEFDARSRLQPAGPLGVLAEVSAPVVVSRSSVAKTTTGALLAGVFGYVSVVHRLNRRRRCLTKDAFDGAVGAPALDPPIGRSDRPLTALLTGTAADRPGVVLVDIDQAEGPNQDRLPSLASDQPIVLPSWALIGGMLPFLAERPVVLLVPWSTDERKLSQVAGKIRGSGARLIGYVCLGSV